MACQSSLEKSMMEADPSGGKKAAYPSLFRSMTPGNIECTYVEVQMMRRMTRRRDWKLKMAVCTGEYFFQYFHFLRKGSVEGVRLGVYRLRTMLK